MKFLEISPATAAGHPLMAAWRWLFDQAPFRSGAKWPDWLAALYVGSNLAITLAFWAIPVCLAVLWHRRRNDLTHPGMLILFVVFIFLEGMTHLFAMTAMWWTPYRFYVLVMTIAAAASLITAFVLPGVVLHILKLPTREMIHGLNDQLHTKHLELLLSSERLREANAALQQRVDRLESQRQTGLWLAEYDRELSDLRQTLRSTGPDGGETTPWKSNSSK